MSVNKKIYRAVLLLSALVMSIGALSPATITAAAARPTQVGQQVIVKFKNDVAPADAVDAISDNGGKASKSIGKLTNTFVVKTSPGKEAATASKLAQDPDVAYAEVDVMGKATSIDPYFSNQWGFENTGQNIVGQTGVNDADIDAPEAWAVTRGTGVKVAVLDSGIDQDHEDISSKIVAQRNFSTAATVDDNYGHGTHVSGIIAASTDNSAGVAGVCPGCLIMNGKVLRDDGYGAASWAANGIVWATDNGAKVINMSIGFTAKSKTLEQAVNYAWSKGVVLVASAGNGNNQAVEYPGGYTNVMAVAATDNRDAKASFSTYGAKWVDITAPGVNVFSTFPNQPFVIQNLYGRSLNYDFGSGTSMSSPMVAGVAALVWSTPYGTSNTAVRNRVQSTADQVAGTGKYWANGRLNAARAVGAQPISASAPATSSKKASASASPLHRFLSLRFHW